jgi:rhodanese-related sulfurtransferase
VAELLAGLDAYPAYYAHMGGRNAVGPDAPDLTSPALVDPAELRRRIDAGEWVVDLRHRRVFAAGHMAETVNVGLPGRLAKVPDGEIWVHCGAGYRASVAASILDAAGRRLERVSCGRWLAACLCCGI